MEITISTTPEQDTTIHRLNVQSNGESTTVDDAVFAASHLSGWIDSATQEFMQADAEALKQQFLAGTPQDQAAILAAVPVSLKPSPVQQIKP